MPSTDPKTAALDELAALVAQRDDLEKRITAAVAKAREERANWTEVGARVGMLRGNAQRKYGPLLQEERTVTVREDT